MKKWVVTLALACALAPVAGVANDLVVNRALGFLGVKYRFGSESETRGFDCAGFVRRTFSALGVHLPRTAALQFREGCIVAREDLLPGDMVFFSRTYKRGISHVGIYLGDGRFIHAASKGQRVKIDELDTPYYSSRFAGGRRVQVVHVASLAP